MWCVATVRWRPCEHCCRKNNIIHRTHSMKFRTQITSNSLERLAAASGCMSIFKKLKLLYKKYFFRKHDSGVGNLRPATPCVWRWHWASGWALPWRSSDSLGSCSPGRCCSMYAHTARPCPRGSHTCSQSPPSTAPGVSQTERIMK